MRVSGIGRGEGKGKGTYSAEFSLAYGKSNTVY